MKKRNRAWRRFQKEKSKQKAFFIFKHKRRDKECGFSDEEIKYKSCLLHENIKNCSHPYCCGNPRRLKGRDGFETKTMQENKAPQKDDFDY
tara:strand:- start:2691 stop:2963 length:273 start_codon:yes stop_codon:yes gene_type:complete